MPSSQVNCVTDSFHVCNRRAQPDRILLLQLQQLPPRLLPQQTSLSPIRSLSRGASPHPPSSSIMMHSKLLERRMAYSKGSLPTLRPRLEI